MYHRLDQLQGGACWTPEVGELLKGPEAVGQVERSGLLVTLVGMLGTQGLYLKKLNAVTGEAGFDVPQHLPPDATAVLVRQDGHDVHLCGVWAVMDERQDADVFAVQ